MTSPKKLKRALVTGATGYIGSNLARSLLNDGWEVHVVTRKNSTIELIIDIVGQLKLHEHDGTTPGMTAIVKAAMPDIVFHLASLFLVNHKEGDVEDLILSNVLFGSQLFEAMTVNNVKLLVNAGTSWQHYENSVYDPVNLYAATKQAAEDLLLYFVRARGLRAISLILFDTYGPGDPRSKIINLLWKTAKTKEPIALSPGNQLIDLVHVSDVIKAFILAADHLFKSLTVYERYGLSSGKPIPLRELVQKFEVATNINLPILWGGISYRNREVMVTWSNFKTLPNWAPKIPFEVGILEAK